MKMDKFSRAVKEALDKPVAIKKFLNERLQHHTSSEGLTVAVHKLFHFDGKPIDEIEISRLMQDEFGIEHDDAMALIHKHMIENVSSAFKYFDMAWPSLYASGIWHEIAAIHEE
jgi:hypothetical protein